MSTTQAGLARIESISLTWPTADRGGRERFCAGHTDGARCDVRSIQNVGNARIPRGLSRLARCHTAKRSPHE